MLKKQGKVSLFVCLITRNDEAELLRKTINVLDYNSNLGLKIMTSYNSRAGLLVT